MGHYDLFGYPMSIEENALACQARCAGVDSCAVFSYWAPQRHCHLHDVLAPRTDGLPLWVSGPPRCHHHSQVHLNARTCFLAHTLFQAELAVAPVANVTSAERCQVICQQTARCAHFSFSTMTGACSLAAAGARQLHPVLFHLSGPPFCQVSSLALWSVSSVWLSMVTAAALWAFALVLASTAWRQWQVKDSSEPQHRALMQPE